MAVIPLKQVATIYKPESVDEWERITPGESFELKCRADEKLEYVKNLASTSLDKEILSTVQLMFDKLPDISYDDVIEFTNELDVTVKGKPMLIEPIRMPNGKATLTAVYL